MSRIVKRSVFGALVLAALLAPASAQGGEGGGTPPAARAGSGEAEAGGNPAGQNPGSQNPAGQNQGSKSPGGKVQGSKSPGGKAQGSKVQVSEAGRAALAAAKDLAARTKGLRGPERIQALEQAATAYDKVVAEFGSEPAIAGAASFAAAELWRQHGSLPLAEKAYLAAAEIDAPRFAQRGLLGAAEMQRRQQRNAEAMATYAKAAAAEPGSSRAQEARLWQARLLQSGGRLDEAISAFQAALESASTPKAAIEAANLLALCCIQKTDLEAAERALDHAEQVVQGHGDDDPEAVERLRKALASMSAKKALQRARDKQNEAAKDAVGLEQSRQAGK